MRAGQALTRLESALPPDVYVSLQLTATDPDVGRRTGLEWTVLVSSDGYERLHRGERLEGVVDEALADFRRSHLVFGVDALDFADAEPENTPPLQMAMFHPSAPPLPLQSA